MQLNWLRKKNNAKPIAVSTLFVTGIFVGRTKLLIFESYFRRSKFPTNETKKFIMKQ